MQAVVLEDVLAARVTAAVRRALDVELTPAQALIRSSTRGGDYQSNTAMSLAKRVGKNPRAVAEAIVAALDSADVVESAEVAGPGFINLTFRRDYLEARTATAAADDRLGIPPVEHPERIIVDYSSPNAAKEMHVGHLRSSIIGDALFRLLTFAGHDVIRQNHVGDWGTPFGMLIEYHVDSGSGDELEISDLDEFYRAARARFDSEPEFAERARTRVALLQGGDARSLELWRTFIGESLRYFAQIYDLLGIALTPEDVCGESFYNPMLADVVADLRAQGLAVESDGAWCVFPDGFSNRDGEPMPVIVQKSDGAYTYDTTDLAAVRHRVDTLKVDRSYYVVGAPQRLHFDLIFATARAAGWLPESATFAHIPFGSVLGSDNKILRTRAGASIKLLDLLSEGVERATTLVQDRTELPAAEQTSIARAVGIGAIKYADLSNDREKDYVFDWDRMLAMDGNTAVYLQYANARVRSVLRKAAEQGIDAEGAPILLAEPAERALALKLLQTAEALRSAIDSLHPHTLCRHLYETAQAFSGFYEKCPVLIADTDELKASRLELCRLTSATIVMGLGLLGIDAPSRL